MLIAAVAASQEAVVAFQEAVVAYRAVVACWAAVAYQVETAEVACQAVVRPS